jgi:UDP-N-acetylmuramate: L-alanyl-gamma-D-glutamyl-meso-diaminopimelate ligase
MRLHFIAIGGSIMHNLAIALRRAGHHVSGSDDEIYEPSRTSLEKAGLLPDETGWNADFITPDLDVVILGMHARADNPELLAARKLRIPVQSFPEFVASQSTQKKRIVVAGSHGKTTTTAMIMHALRSTGYDFDYLVGARLQGFDLSVRISDAPVIILEGDEYLSSPVDRRPKFLHYSPQIVVVTGVAWDHMNVFPTYDDYLAQFDALLTNQLENTGEVFAFAGDKSLRALLEMHPDLTAYRYEAVPHSYRDGKAVVMYAEQAFPMQFFGAHNFQNLRAAQLVCAQLGVAELRFYEVMQSFEGAAMRLEALKVNSDIVVYRDFAHAPSKVKATVEAVRSRYPVAPLTAMLELHTYSSLNKDFLPLYLHTLSPADTALVYYSPHTLQMKKLPPVSPEEIAGHFGGEVQVFTDIRHLIEATPWDSGGVHLWMSSGRFAGTDIPSLYQSR